MTTQFPTAIAIDGPAASGKSTVGRMLADYLGYLFLDTGCMYRAVTLTAISREVVLEDEGAVVDLAEGLEMNIEPPGNFSDGRLYTVYVDSTDVTWALRSGAVDDHVSLVSTYRGVRENLVSRQREIARRGKVVVVGRDIGTVVLPDAPLKLYIIASAEVRARRRWMERREQKQSDTYEDVLSDINRRDQIDGHRLLSPMRPAEHAITIDTTSHSPEEILEEILSLDYFHSSEQSINTQ